MLILKHSFPSLNVCTGYPDNVYHVYPEQVHEEPKVDIVTLANTIRDEGTMMVKPFHADIALTTVNRALWPHNHA